MFVLFALPTFDGTLGLHAQQEIPLHEILARMSKNDSARALELKHYTSTRSYYLHNHRFKKTAEMTVKVTYRHPGLKEFLVLSESGPAPIRAQVLRRLVNSEAEASRAASGQSNQISSMNYDFRLARLEQDEGRRAYVLEAVPKSKSKYLMRGEVWVDAEDFAVSRIVGQPAKSPSVWVRNSRFEYRYAKFGAFWLPVSTDSEAEAVVFGHTEVKIRNQNYQINAEQGAAVGAQ